MEMLGVKLKASWVQTRKANGDIVQSRIERKQLGSGKVESS